MPSPAAISRSSHHQPTKKSLVASSTRVMPGSWVSISAKTSLKAGTATAMMIINTTMATTMTMAG